MADPIYLSTSATDNSVGSSNFDTNATYRSLAPYAFYSAIVIHSLVADIRIVVSAGGAALPSGLEIISTCGFGTSPNNTYNYNFKSIQTVQDVGSPYTEGSTNYYGTTSVVLVDKTAPIKINTSLNQYLCFNSSVDCVTGFPGGATYTFDVTYTIFGTALNADNITSLGINSISATNTIATSLISINSQNQIVQSVYATNYPPGGGANPDTFFELFLTNGTNNYRVGTSLGKTSSLQTNILASVGKNPLYVPPSYGLYIQPYGPTTTYCVDASWIVGS